MHLNAWRTARGINYAELARLLGLKFERTRRLCLPDGDPLRRIPRDQATIDKIAEVTNGAVTIADFYAAPSRRKRAA